MKKIYRHITFVVVSFHLVMIALCSFEKKKPPLRERIQVRTHLIPSVCSKVDSKGGKESVCIEKQPNPSVQKPKTKKTETQVASLKQNTKKQASPSKTIAKEIKPQKPAPKKEVSKQKEVVVTKQEQKNKEDKKKALLLTQKLQETVAKIAQKEDKGGSERAALSVELPREVKAKLEPIDPVALSESQIFSEGYAELLIDLLGKRLYLPESGEVKLKLTIASSGEVSSVEVVHASSAKSGLFLQEKVLELTLPPFTKELQGCKEYVVVVVFSDE